MADNRVIELALAAHTQAIKALMDHVEGGDRVVPASIAEEHLCHLGRWLREEGSQYATWPEYQEALDLHERFHHAVRELLDLCAAGRWAEAKARLAGGSAFAQLSRRMLLAFDALSAAIAASQRRD